jgi:putative transposase
MAKFFRKDAHMTLTISPSPAVSPRGQMTAQQRACLEQIARRQTSPPRLVRRATMLLALETGVTQGHVMRQMPLHRGTGQRWGRRWGALVPTLAQMETEAGRDKALTPMMVGALADPPRAGTPATFTAEQLVEIVAGACEAPADSGRPGSPWTPREGAEEGRQRGLIETISTRRGGRVFKSGGCAAPSGRVLAQRQAGGPRGVHRPSGGRVRG